MEIEEAETIRRDALRKEESAAILVRRIDSIVRLLPRSLPNRKEFVEQLQAKRNAACSQQQGIINIVWNDVRILIDKYIGPLDDRPWVQQVWNVFTSNEPE